MITNVEALLQSRNLYGGTFSSIGEHSPIANIRAALEQVKQSGSDIIVAVGGGSPIDASKAIIFYHQQEAGGAFMKQIAIPTTLSAAEYTVIYIALDSEEFILTQCVDHCRVHE